MRGIVKTLMTNSEEPIEIHGFEDGYQGLIYSRFRVMSPADFSGILTRGGTILGTSRTPFKRLDIPEADGVEKVPAMVHTYHKLQLDCLFYAGRQRLHQDRQPPARRGPQRYRPAQDHRQRHLGHRDDVWLYERHRRRHQVHRRHSHHRFEPRSRVRHRDHGTQGRLDSAICRRRGRRGCHPDSRDPYDMDNVIKTIEHRMETGSRFTIVAVAEGAISKEDAALPKKDYKRSLPHARARRLSTTSPREIEAKTGRETRVAIPGHKAWRPARRSGPHLLRPSVASKRRSAACAASLAT